MLLVCLMVVRLVILALLSRLPRPRRDQRPAPTATGELGRKCKAEAGDKEAMADQQRVPIDDALDAEPLAVHEQLGGRQLPTSMRAAAGDRAPDRVLGRMLDRADQPQHVGALDAVGEDVDETHAAGRDGAGLVEHDGVDASGRLEHLRAL